ncbi:MAG: TraK family protein [Myxococcales bacterium]|nr:TraK family protein [Myxococcales bacterium]
MPRKDNKKSLRERVAEYARAQGDARRTRHKAAFTALLPDIEDTLADGLSMRLTWEYLSQEGQIDMSYDTFRRLCKEAGLRNRSRIRASKRRAEEEGAGTGTAATTRKSDAAGHKPRKHFPDVLTPRVNEFYGD